MDRSKIIFGLAVIAFLIWGFVGMLGWIFLVNDYINPAGHQYFVVFTNGQDVRNIVIGTKKGFIKAEDLAALQAEISTKVKQNVTITNYQLIK